MLKHRFNYWTCSKFADFIRGEKKPYALEWHKWGEWKDQQKKKRPIRFWLSDTLLDKLQDFFYFPYDVYSNVKSYVRNRWIDKTHYLKTGLKPGDYHEFDTRILYGLFNELVDYVEIELAHLSKWDRTKSYKFNNGRCVEAAYDYFEWVNNLQKESDKIQKENCIKIRELYEWWTKQRPNRDNPLTSITAESHDEKYYKLIHDIEQDYYNEDTEMLIELIKIRNGLWT